MALVTIHLWRSILSRDGTANHLIHFRPRSYSEALNFTVPVHFYINRPYILFSDLIEPANQILFVCTR